MPNSADPARDTNDGQLGDLRAALDRDGFVRIPPDVFRLDKQTLTALRDEFQKLFSGFYETGVYPDEIHWRKGISRPDLTRELCNAWKASRLVRRVVCHETLAELAARLMGWSHVRLAQDDVIHKPPPPVSSSSQEPGSSLHSAVVGFHQDGAYIADNFLPQQNNCLTMWIALDDADEEHGALQYAPGSHKWPFHEMARDVSASFHVAADETKDEIAGQLQPKHLDPLVEAAQRAGQDPRVVLQSVQTVAVPAGGLVVHHQQTWHGSGPNRSQQDPPRPRRALVAHLLNGEVQWRTEPPPHYIYGRYRIRGESVPREDFFPILYSSQPKIDRTAWLTTSRPGEVPWTQERRHRMTDRIIKYISNAICYGGALCRFVDLVPRSCINVGRLFFLASLSSYT